MRRLAVLFTLSWCVWAQSTGTVTGSVTDPNGAAIVGARIRIENPLTGFERELLSEADGSFSIVNLAFANYVVQIEAPGFVPARKEISLRTNVPLTMVVSLRIAENIQSVEVRAFDIGALVQPEATGTQTALDASTIGKFPTQAGSRGLESVLVSLPGFAMNANGAIHPRGAHNQMTYVIDGMPISDQLTGAFANSVDPSIIENIDLFTGNVPAEYGNKVSGVANITTRSGLGSGRKFSASTQVGAAGFDTLTQLTQIAGGTDRFGYFVSANAVKTHRYLDQVSLDNLHNGGNSERMFSRFDINLGPRDLLRANLMAGRSSFELANLRSQQAAGQDQRQVLRDFSASLGWVHTLSPRATLDSTASYRTTVAQLFPSAGDTPVTAAQARHLSNISLAGRFNFVSGPHTVRAGGDYLHFPVSENFSFGITDPSFNRPGAPGFIPTLLAHDLSRGGRLFHFSGRDSGNMYTGFAQDMLKWSRFTLSLGLRYDAYRFLVHGRQLQPRVGLAYHITETGTVLRASYNRTYQTPPNENLLLSNSDASSVLVPPDVRETLGGALIRIRPERQNVYEAGLQQSVAGRASISAAYYHKDSRDMQDNDNFFNTGIIFPTALQRSRVNGAEMRAVAPVWKGLSGTLSMTHYHAVVTPPFTGGLFLGSAAIDLLSSGPFVIDHDQTLGMHGMVQYNWKKGFWTTWSIRHDSGLVSNPSDPVEVARNPDYADLLPYVNLTSNPPRVNPRTVYDFAVGYEATREGRKRWDAQFNLFNLTNQTALFNFQSIFVGTRLIEPRSAGLKVRWHW
ncbi:MAG: TonB-dependent receptor [Bryobacterales bacterium]|nr:TonB-dependent receptor [Bryobacterales bacterium]